MRISHSPKSWDNNFTLLRIVAAFFVLTSHSFGILQKGSDQPGFFYDHHRLILSDFGLYIFFTISGFLVTQSFYNSNSIKHYLWKRFLRIVPALGVALIMCIIMGCWITELPVKQYLFNKETWLYFFRNISLVVNQFVLPGVFPHLIDESINASLWTISLEIKFYVLLIFAGLYLFERKWLYLSGFILFQAIRIVLQWKKIELQRFDLEFILIYGTYFYLGSLFYCWRYIIPFKWFYANILLAIAFATVYTPFESITLAFFIAYCTIIIANSKAVLSFKNVDVSYGFYLYAFPVQQLLLLHFGYKVNVLLHIFLATVISLGLGFVSFYLVEKPFLKLKNVTV